MNRYLVDFEFITPDGRHYWLPLAFQAKDGQKARQIADRFHHGLEQTYQVQRSGPYVVGSKLEDLISEFRRGHRKGEPAFLEIVEHRVRNVAFDPKLTIDEHIGLAVQQVGTQFLDEPAVIDSIKKRSIPVRLLTEGEFAGLRTLLVINIISPDVPDQPRSIPAESVELGKVTGMVFRATIYRTPQGEIAVGIDVSDKASELDQSRDRMNTKIWEKSIELTGDHPLYYVTQKVRF